MLERCTEPSPRMSGLAERFFACIPLSGSIHRCQRRRRPRRRARDAAMSYGECNEDGWIDAVWAVCT